MTQNILTREQIGHCEAISLLIELEDIGFSGCDVQPVFSSKQFIYKLLRDGEPVCKVRVLPFKPDNLKQHYLLNSIEGIRSPKIIDVIKFEENLYKFVEWIPGKPINVLSHSNSFEDIEDRIIYEWGKCMGKINEVKIYSACLSIVDIWWFNFVWDGNEVVCVDMSKLHVTETPMMDIFKWIVFNPKMSLKKKSSFLKGYFKETKLNEKVRESIDSFLKLSEGKQ